ncbi:ankyrin repeat domain-containing protein [Thorsellia kenyensis]|uniref:Ankyrin repeat domain-containing protein n=1 Tax=Thorsellia kenyensis TaxID=1549888 RepID=A0ABV6C7Z7_9GAMM
MKKKGMLFIFILLIGFSSWADNSFRYNMNELKVIANEKVFPNRIFYENKSEGPYSDWFDAVKKGNYHKVKNLIENEHPIDVKDEASLGQTALGWAAFIGYKDIVELLVKHGASLKATDNADVKHVFKSAIMGGNIEIIEYIYSLSKDFVDINELEDDGETMLIVASYAGRLDSVKFLLANGANVNIISEQKQHNALTYACTQGHEDVVNLLLRYGAINFRTGLNGC